MKTKLKFVVANDRHRKEIYRIRHEIYASELRQHPENSDAKLSDSLDKFNIYIVALLGEKIVGFVSVTPPEGGHYSVDKYLSRNEFPFQFNDKLYEVRLLTVLKPFRRTKAASLLMYAAFRWVESRGGTRIVAIGRRDILDIYLRAGLKPLSRNIQSGAIVYESLSATIESLRRHLKIKEPLIKNLENKIDWQLGISFYKPDPCFHGGAFFKAIGEDFSSLEKSRDIINADVLDAWFPPSPKVVEALTNYLPWLIRTSPPTNCEGLVKNIAGAREIPIDTVVAGAGSSSLIYLAFREWISRSSRALILDPTYGEYAHILEQVIGCRTDRYLLNEKDDFRINLDDFEKHMTKDYDLVVLVNPNNPTGHYVEKDRLEEILNRSSKRTLFWIDEAYVDYLGEGKSLEHFASKSENVIVCKSMSKVYALSGMRVAYLCGARHLIESLKGVIPPWAVGLPSQVAASAALQDYSYYKNCYQETNLLRNQLTKDLASSCGIRVISDSVNFILCELPITGPDAQEVIKECNRQNLFLRDVGTMGKGFGSHIIRIAVKDAKTNDKIVRILADVFENLKSLKNCSANGMQSFS